MDNEKFSQYLKKFEKKVLIAGMEQGILSATDRMVPIKPGRLNTTAFGQALGENFDYHEPLAFDYYGMLKKSSGFVGLWRKYADRFEIKSALAPVIHFASVKVEHINNLDPDLVLDFVAFKKKLVELRNFNNNK